MGPVRIDVAGRTSDDDPLLTARFVVPAPPTGVVVRPRLLEQVSRGVEGPLTLLSAPAGAGKTVLLSSWAAAQDPGHGPEQILAWVAMDEGHERAGAFWGHVIEALGRAGLDLSGVGTPARTDTLDRGLLHRLAQAVADHPVPVVLVVDAGASVVDRRLGGDLDHLILSAGDNLHVVLLVRADPAMSLHRYRLADQMTEVRLSDLRFDDGEARVLMDRAEIEPTEAQVAALVTRTGGWAAGLKFAAMAAAGQVDPGPVLDDFTGSDASVSDYLSRELLDNQLPDVREVLLRTSIVDDLTPELCTVLTGRPHGTQLLQGLARDTAVVQRQSGAYRYQPMIREFLRAHLRYEYPELVPELHTLAAAWHHGRGMLEPAVRHAIAAGDWELAAAYVVSDLGIAALAAEAVDPGLAGLFGTMPPEADGVAASLVRAARAVAHRDGSRCTAALRRARDQLTEVPAPPVTTSFSLRLLELVASAVGYDVESAAPVVRRLERQLVAELRGPSERHPEVAALIGLCSGRLLVWDGDLDRAAAALAKAADLAVGPRCLMLRLQSLGLAALVQAAGGRLRHATASLADLDDEARAVGIERSLRPASSAIARAWVAADELRLADAWSALDDADARSTDRNLLTTTLLCLVRARVLRAGGDLPEARLEVEAARLALHEARDEVTPPCWLDALLVATEATIAVATGHADEAVDLLLDPRLPDRPEVVLALDLALLARDGTEVAEELPPVRADPGQSLDCRLTAGLVEVVRRVTTDDAADAGPALDAVLRLAAPERFRRPFAEAPEGVQQMLKAGGRMDRNRWLGDIVSIPAQRTPEEADDSAAPAHVRTTNAGVLVVEPLTAKELEVLGHLAELLTTDEIAETMFISVNTVRTHVRNILRKLGATRRNEAVRVAWELHLLPDGPADR